MSLGRLQPGQMPGDGTIKDSGSGSLAQVGEPRIPVKPVGGWPSQQQEKPPPPPPPPGGKEGWRALLLLPPPFMCAGVGAGAGAAGACAGAREVDVA